MRVPRLSPDQLAVATPEERAMYQRALHLEQALLSPLDYAEHVSKRTERYAHTELLSTLIVQLVTGKLRHPVTQRPVRKLAVSMPPRHGKSYVISDHTPAWAVTRWAKYGFRVGLAAYEADVGAGWGRKARDHVKQHPEFGALIDNTRRSSDAWDVLPSGPDEDKAGMDTAGVGGPFTSKGFHLLIIDDPIKNNEWAMSQTIRDKQYEWLGSTALTRLEPTLDTEEDDEPVGHAVILVNTRWHEDDLMGRVLKDEGEDWYHLNLKALADEAAPSSDILRRQPGAALCPARYDEGDLEKIRTSPVTGGYWWAAMYQGEPNIEGGGIFKRTNFRYHRPGPGDHALTHVTLRDPSGQELYIPRGELARFSTLDTAATDKTRSDWSVLSTWDVTKDRKMILTDRVRKRMESADLPDWAYENFTRLDPRPAYIGIGAKTFGLTVITQLTRMGVPVRPLPEDIDKVSRAITAGNMVDQGRVYFPEAAPWLSEWEHELLQFPNGVHDDQVDTFSLAAREIAIGMWSVPVREKVQDGRSTEERLARYIERKRKDKRRQTRRGMSGRLGL